jgi:uncharacterized protein YdhG (YjbR/CyaY superfamily)
VQYDAKNANEYLSLLEDDWRKEKLLLIRDIIKSYAPELKEGICYKMLCYGGDQPVFALNAQKGYVSLYVGNIEKVDDAKLLLKGFDIGKGCIRIKKSINIQDTGLERFIKQTVDIWRRGGETVC